MNGSRATLGNVRGTSTHSRLKLAVVHAAAPRMQLIVVERRRRRDKYVKQAVKGVLAVAALPFAALPLALGGGTASAAAAGGLMPARPATVLTHGPTPWEMPEYLHGAGCQPPRSCEQVLYWWIISTPGLEVGVDENLFNLDYAIDDADGPKIVYAFSGGARIATAWLTEHAAESDIPAEELSFLLLGNGTRKYGGLSTWVLGDSIVAPPTRYEVIDVAREYDPIADFPTNPFNLLAMANALAGFNVIHMDYRDVDLDDPDNYVWTENNTTYVFVPTESLPLLQPLRNLGLGWVADQWEAPLRAIIDTAYRRTYLPAQPQGDQGADALSAHVGPTSRSAVAPAGLVSDEADAATTVTSEGLATDPERVTDAAEAAAGDDGPTSDGAENDHEADAAGSDEAEADGEEDEADVADTSEAQAEADTVDAEADSDTDDVNRAETEQRTGPKHRAPLNGIKKVSVAASEATDAGDASADGGSEDSDPTSDSNSSS